MASASSSTHQPVKVSIGTFNVNGQAPGQIDLDQWLHISRDEPDILVVGLEEAETSNLSYLVWTPYVEDGWSAAVESSMGSASSNYAKLTSKQLVGTLMLIYVRKEVTPRISNLATSSVGVGFGGWAANKGATAVRFDLDEDLPVCFVVAHLSAFDTPDARERRRWDYNEIVKRLRFILIDSNSEGEFSESGDGKAIEKREIRERIQDAESMLRAQLNQEFVLSVDDRADLSAWREGIKTRQVSIMDHDVIFWAGDLNFRLELGIGEVKRLIKERRFESVLLNYDQLRNEMQARSSFQDFHEQKIE